MTHTELLKSVLKLSQQRPFAGRCTLIKNNTGRRGRVSFGCVGWSDIIGWGYDGRFSGLEIKVGRDKLSDDQIDFRDALSPVGYWFEIRSETEAILALKIICNL